MGMILPRQPTDPLEPDVVVTDTAAPPPPGGPDAGSLALAEFPLRAVPTINGMRERKYQVIFRQSVLSEMHAHGKSSTDCEVCGVLVGNVYQDGAAPWAHIEAAIRGNGAVGKQTQVTITSETWSRIHETLEKDYPGRQIVGWYHTHPGFGIFLSGMDLFIQDNFFNQPWQIAFVYDPIGKDEGCFIWRAGKSEREPFLIETGAAQSSGGGMDMIGGDALTDLTRRVRALERRLDVLLTGFLILILLALVVPLVILYFAPDAFNFPARNRQHQSPPTSQPAAPGAPNHRTAPPSSQAGALPGIGGLPGPLTVPAGFTWNA